MRECCADGNTLELLREISTKTRKSVAIICSDFIKRQIEWAEDEYDLKMIKHLGKIDESKAIPADDVRKMLDTLSD